MSDEMFGTAANILCNIPELLELILLHLPIKDTLLLQRTDKAICNTVADFIHLRRKLYYPTNLDIQPEYFWRFDRGDNPLFTILHPIWSPTENNPWHLRSQYTGSCVHRTDDPKDPNDGIAFPAVQLDFALNGSFCKRYELITSYDDRVITGSWREMLVIRTPTKTHIKVAFYTCRSSYPALRSASFANTVTMGGICDCLAKAYMETVGSEEWWKWTTSGR